MTLKVKFLKSGQEGNSQYDLYWCSALQDCLPMDLIWDMLPTKIEWANEQRAKWYPDTVITDVDIVVVHSWGELGES